MDLAALASFTVFFAVAFLTILLYAIGVKTWISARRENKKS